MGRRRPRRADRRLPGRSPAHRGDVRLLRRRRLRLGLYLRRRSRLRPLQDQVHDVARGRARRARLRWHRSAVVGVDKFLPEREHEPDFFRDLHDHDLRLPDPVQRRLLRPHKRPLTEGCCSSRCSRPRCPGGHTRWAASWRCSADCSGRRRRSSSTPRVSHRRRTCSISVSTRPGRPFSCSRSGSAASPAGRSATAPTATRCSPTSPMSPMNFWSAISR